MSVTYSYEGTSVVVMFYESVETAGRQVNPTCVADTVSLMRSAAALMIGLFVAARSFGSSNATTASTVVTLPAFTTTEPPPTTTTTTEPPLEICDPLETFPGILPERVVVGLPETGDVDFDEFTLLEGAFTAMRFDEAGDPVLVMIRGALPPRQFTAESEVVEILDGIPSLVGPIGDGYWAAAWALPPGDRCDLYSLIFYPPTSSEEGLEVIASVR